MCDAFGSNIDFKLLQFHCYWLDGKMHHTNPQCLLCESTLFEQSMLPPMRYLACSCTFMRKEWYALVYVWYALCFCKRRHFKLTPFHFDSTQSWLLRMYLEVCLVVARCLLVDDMHAHTPTPWLAWQQTEMRWEAVWTETRWEAVCLHPNSCIHPQTRRHINFILKMVVCFDVHMWWQD